MYRYELNRFEKAKNFLSVLAFSEFQISFEFYLYFTEFIVVELIIVDYI